MPLPDDQPATAQGPALGPVPQGAADNAAQAAALPARALQRLAESVQRKGLLDDSAALADGSRMPSPCINVCTMGPVFAEPSEPLCLGCLRSLPEIIEWGAATEARQQAIWHEVLQRMQAVQQAPSATSVGRPS